MNNDNLNNTQFNCSGSYIDWIYDISDDLRMKSRVKRESQKEKTLNCLKLLKRYNCENQIDIYDLDLLISLFSESMLKDSPVLFLSILNIIICFGTLAIELIPDSVIGMAIVFFIVFISLIVYIIKFCCMIVGYDNTDIIVNALKMYKSIIMKNSRIHNSAESTDVDKPE